MRWKLMHSSSKLSSLLASDQNIPMAIKNPSNSPLNVNEEYKKSLRSKSFLDMWSKVHDQNLRRTVSYIAAASSSSGVDDNCRVKARTDSPSSSPLSYTKLPDFLLEPSQESVVAATAAINDRSARCLQVHSLLLEFFDVTFQACAACANLLASISRARLHHQLIHHLLLELSSAACFADDGDCPAFEFDHLASLVDGSENPLHPRSLAGFHSVRSAYRILVQRLTRARRQILRRARLVRAARKATAAAAVTACSIAAAMVVAIAVHTVIGFGVVVVAAAPVAMATAAPHAAMRWAKAAGKVRPAESLLDRLAAQVDTAAKGAYIVGREFDTMSRMVQRAHDELEHERHVARMVVRGRERRQLVREAAREVESGAVGMAEQLEELEEHVHLCLITINRSRKMVAEELMVDGAPASLASIIET